jgi:hypothetical protein
MSFCNHKNTDGTYTIAAPTTGIIDAAAVRAKSRTGLGAPK